MAIDVKYLFQHLTVIVRFDWRKGDRGPDNSIEGMCIGVLLYLAPVNHVVILSK